MENSEKFLMEIIFAGEFIFATGRLAIELGELLDFGEDSREPGCRVKKWLGED